MRRYEVKAARMSAGKIVGLVFGCLVIGVMLFMLLAILGGLLSGGE